MIQLKHVSRDAESSERSAGCALRSEDSASRLTLVVIAIVLLGPAFAHADGGTVRFSEQRGGYQITLFTSPTQPRAGIVDFSVMIQAAGSETPLFDVPVEIHAFPVSNPDRRIGGMATSAAATNKLFRAIQLELNEPGPWRVEVVVADASPPIQIETDLEVGPPLPSWIDLGMWIGWPTIVIVLFVIHQCLVRRSQSLGR